jgi:hypothetical protein
MNALEALLQMDQGWETGVRFILDHEGTKTEFKVIKGEYDCMFVQWEPFNVYEHYSHLPGVVDGTAGICILD